MKSDISLTIVNIDLESALHSQKDSAAELEGLPRKFYYSSY